MYLGYFIVSALDLLDAIHTASTETERQGFIDWIYRCQHPNGGFRMWPGTDLGSRANSANARWDPANIPATYFALATLLLLNDDFSVCIGKRPSRGFLGCNVLMARSVRRLLTDRLKVDRIHGSAIALLA